MLVIAWYVIRAQLHGEGGWRAVGARGCGDAVVLGQYCAGLVQPLFAMRLFVEACRYSRNMNTHQSLSFCLVDRRLKNHTESHVGPALHNTKGHTK